MKATVNDVKNFLSNYGFNEYVEFYNTIDAVSYKNMIYIINCCYEKPFLRIGQRYIKGKTIKLFKKLEKTYPNVFKIGNKTVGNNTFDILYINI